ncbi:MAG: NHL repeat-containing protein, partial [Verrucomicrobiota bacterium]
PTGTWLKAFGEPGSDAGSMSYPYDLVWDHQNHLYVCEFGNSRIQVLNDQGKTLEILGGPGSAVGKLSNPWSIALDSTGSLYVADAANHRVQKWIRKPSTTSP